MDLSYVFISIALFHFGSYASKFDDEYSNTVDISHNTYSESKDVSGYCIKCENITIPSDYTYKEGLGYYKFNSTKVTWNAARRFCEKEGAHLVIPDSLEELNYLVELRGSNTQTWLGIHDYFRQKQWVTVLDKDATYLRWYDNEPNKLNTELCVVLLHDMMYTANCKRANLTNFICEKNC